MYPSLLPRDTHMATNAVAAMPQNENTCLFPGKTGDVSQSRIPAATFKST
jgi:hypothetical protein